MENLSVDQGHSSQMATISSIAAKDVHPWESPQCKLGEISVIRGVDIVTNRSISLFSVAFQLVRHVQNHSNLFKREGKRFVTHSN